MQLYDFRDEIVWLFLSLTTIFHEVLLLHCGKSQDILMGLGCHRQEETHEMTWRGNR